MRVTRLPHNISWWLPGTCEAQWAVQQLTWPVQSDCTPRRNHTTFLKEGRSFFGQVK